MTIVSSGQTTPVWIPSHANLLLAASPIAMNIVAAIRWTVSHLNLPL